MELYGVIAGGLPHHCIATSLCMRVPTAHNNQAARQQRLEEKQRLAREKLRFVVSMDCLVAVEAPPVVRGGAQLSIEPRNSLDCQTQHEMYPIKTGCCTPF